MGNSLQNHYFKMKKNKKVFITGGAGFIGYFIAKELIARGDKVRMMGWSPDKAAAHLKNRPREESSTPSSIGLMHGAPHK